jgi:SAM-dependent methyltransferase
VGLLKGDWREGLPSEIHFWESALRDPDRNWVRSEYDERMNPNLELQSELRELIPASPGATVRILDVGSGPLTRVGKRWEARDLQIVAVDPLGDEYSGMCKRLALRPLVPVTAVHGERLLESFSPDSFDLAYASNSLDHSYDPLVVIDQMLALVKPERYVYLWHFMNGGVAEAYTGLHQWNFDVRKGDFVIHDGRTARSVSAAFGGKAQVTTQCIRAFDSDVVVAKLKKLA